MIRAIDSILHKPQSDRGSMLQGDRTNIFSLTPPLSTALSFCYPPVLVEIKNCHVHQHLIMLTVIILITKLKMMGMSSVLQVWSHKPRYKTRIWCGVIHWWSVKVITITPERNLNMWSKFHGNWVNIGASCYKAVNVLSFQSGAPTDRLHCIVYSTSFWQCACKQYLNIIVVLSVAVDTPTVL